MTRYNYRGHVVHQCDYDVWVTYRGRLVLTADDTWEAEDAIDARLARDTGEVRHDLR